ncbi:MAG: hypothetical protein L3J79_08445 [Candidatus Marinimicrobia bacterium]|nr:hypothetical protein [Candidatus Neomarinimicrobiota bacterium]
MDTDIDDLLTKFVEKKSRSSVRSKLNCIIKVVQGLTVEKGRKPGPKPKQQSE